jgi:archaeal flagellar protein FlaJ
MDDTNSKKLEILKKEVYRTKDDNSDLNIDLDTVQNIVTKMKKRSSKQGTSANLSEGHLKELRDIIAEGKLSKLNIDTEAKLISSSDTKLNKQLSAFYKPFSKLINLIIKSVLNNKIGKNIAFNLYSANIKRSLIQHLILSTIFSLLISGFISLLCVILIVFLKPLLLIIVPFILLIIFIFFFIFLSYVVPLQKAKQRGIYIDVELPFALRHLATELQAGIGLYKTIESISVNDYGVLSDEFSRTVLEIENGTDTKTALRHAALRSKSKNFNIALFHIIRTLNTGGNLSESINSVADNVSFELMESARVFGEKMNFFGIIFIFMAIVLPVFVSVLAAIANAPIGTDGAAFLPGIMSPTILGIIYCLVMPILFVCIIYYIKVIEPKT